MSAIGESTALPALVAGFFMRSRMAGMKFRKLRIARSAMFTIACALLAEI
jgi:hypothetical protein